MAPRLILASQSAIRAQMLAQAGVPFDAIAARIDEETVKASLIAENARPREIADTLAELKARKISEKHPDALVLGSDQVLDFEGRLLSKANTRDEAECILKEMRGKRHMLLSAAVIYEAGQPQWRHVGQVRLMMRDISDAYLTAYLDRNWPGISDAVGCYKLEQEGVRLFSRVDGDYFTVLGMPLFEILSYLSMREVIES